ncbi:MAG: hypothetical protein EZS28_012826, partial [Streblomastix strix]
ASVKPTLFKSELEKALGYLGTTLNRQNFNFQQLLWKMIYVKYQGQNQHGLHQSLQKIQKEHEDEDTFEALSYSAAISKTILEIGDEIARYDKRIFKKHQKKLMRAYRLSEDAERRSQVVREKGAIPDKAKGARDSIPPQGLFRKNT